MKYVFNVDYVNKKKGTICTFNGAIAGQLLRRGIISPVAVKAVETGKKTASNEPPIKVVVEPPKRKRK